MLSSPASLSLQDMQHIDVVFFVVVVVFYFFIYLFMAALGLHCCARAFSSCGERGPLFLAVCGLLTVVASLVVEHGL